MTIGIVRSIFFDDFYILWSTFFNELGINILVSPMTNQDILNKGIKNSIYESCLALKVYTGHVYYLKDKVNYILIPKILSKNTCPCYRQLNDFISDTFNTNILSYNVNLDDLAVEEFEFIKIGKILGFNKEESKRAYNTAKKEEYKKKKIDYLIQKRKITKKNKKILVIGPSYFINDNIFFKNLKDIMNDNNIEIIYSYVINPDKKIENKLYFFENNVAFQNIINYKKEVNSIVILTTYPCEPQFELISWIINDKRFKNIPIYFYELNKNNEDFVNFLKGEIYE